MPLTLEQKTNVRRHLEFGVIGLPMWSPAGGSLATGNNAYRFLEAWGQLEYRLNFLDGNEEARLLGLPLGAVAIVGPAMVSGITFSVTITGGGLVSPVTITYTSTSEDNQQSVAAQLSQLCNNNSALLAAGFYAVSPYGYGAFSAAVATQVQPGGPQTGNPAIPIAQFSILNNQAANTFTLAASSNGIVSAVVTATGALLAPKSTVDPTPPSPVIIYGYLPLLDYLEGAQVASTQNLDTSIAGAGGKWVARHDEPWARERLYKMWVRKMHVYLFGLISQTGSFGLGGGGNGAGLIGGFSI